MKSYFASYIASAGSEAIDATVLVFDKNLNIGFRSPDGSNAMVTAPELPSATLSAPVHTPVTVPDSASDSTSVPSMGGDGVGTQVVEINERMALLSAQLAELELRAKIAAKVAEINNIGKKDKTEEKKSPELVSSLGQGFMNQGSGVIAPSQPAVPPLPKQSSSATVVMPVIQSVEGVDGHLKATLRVSGQGSKTVRVGQTVAGWAVRDLRIDGVTVQKGKVVQELYFEDSSRDVGAIDTSAAGLVMFASWLAGSNIGMVPASTILVFALIDVLTGFCAACWAYAAYYKFRQA